MLFTKYKVISSEWDISKGCFLPLHLSAEVSTILREERTEIYQTSKDEMASRSEGNVFHHFLPTSFLLFFSRSVFTLHDPMDCSTQASLSFTISRSLLQLMATESVTPKPSRPLSSPSPPAFNISQPQGLFWWVSSSHQVAYELAYLLLTLKNWRLSLLSIFQRAFLTSLLLRL